MPLEWDALREHLAAEIRTAAARAEYETLRRHDPVALPFGTPEAAIRLLVDPDAPIDDKNAICRPLIVAARCGRRVALSILLLGMWPGLSALYFRDVRFHDRPDRLISLIAISFIEAVANIDLQHSRQPIATLILNARRGIDERKRLGRMETLDPIFDADRELDLVTVLRDPSPIGLRSHLADEDAVWILRCWLVQQVGPDADLVVAAVIEGYSQADLARLLRVRPTAVRSRVHRALRQLRCTLSDPKKSLQHLVAGSAYPVLRGPDMHSRPAIPCCNHDGDELTPVATVHVGERSYCAPCAGRAPSPPPHLFGTACWLTGDLKPAAICPRCLYDAFAPENLR